MNSSPQKYGHFERYGENNIEKVKMSLRGKDMERFKKLQEEIKEQKSSPTVTVDRFRMRKVSKSPDVKISDEQAES